MRRLIIFILFFATLPTVAMAGGADAHSDPVAKVALLLVIVLAAAKLGGELATRLGQPAVLGELLAGVALGNLPLLGITALDPLWSDPSLDMLARLGVLLLLFEVGLESTVAQMMKVGPTSLIVAALGVAAPFGLGYLCSMWLLPEHGPYVHAFVGATLCATSVGITARVFQDLGKLQTPEARIILGAAVIDDVLGLIVLAVVGGIIAAANSGGGFAVGSALMILVKAVAFLVGALVIGVYLSPRLFRIASRLHARGVLLALGLSWCFLLSYLANAIGLAPIVGAFAAGLVLEDVHYKDFKDRGEHTLEELIHPLAGFLAPVFFIVMGLRTDLRAFAAPGVLVLALAITVAAILGKQACSLGVWKPGIDRLTVGIGMVPRGEVGLIFANIGLGLAIDGHPVIDKNTFSAIVVMVILTTLLTPFGLKLSLARRRAAPTS